VSFRKQNQKEASRPKQLTRQLRPNSNSDRSREFSNSAVPRDQLVRTNAKTNFYRGQTSNKFDPFNALPVGEEGHFHYLISNSRLPAPELFFFTFTNTPSSSIPLPPYNSPVLTNQTNNRRIGVSQGRNIRFSALTYRACTYINFSKQPHRY
jgi:hypothetical protein